MIVKFEVLLEKVIQGTSTEHLSFGIASDFSIHIISKTPHFQ